MHSIIIASHHNHDWSYYQPHLTLRTVVLLFSIIIILIYLHVRISPLSFHFIIICDQRSVPTASPPDCPSTLASRKGKSWEIMSAVFKILCQWPECFKVYLDSMIIRSVNERCPCCGRGSACCKRAKNMIICSDLFYIIFFFHPFSCGKAVLFGKGVSRQVLLSPPMRCFYPAHTTP